MDSIILAIVLCQIYVQASGINMIEDMLFNEVLLFMPIYMLCFR